MPPKHQTQPDPDLPQTQEETMDDLAGPSDHLAAFTVEDVETDHFDTGIIDLDDNGDPIADEIDDVPEVIEQLDKEAFYVVFHTAFLLPGTLLTELEPLAIQENEAQPARAASDAIYALLQIYYPSALMPQGETIAHIIAAAPFLMMKVMIVREVMRKRREPVTVFKSTQPKEAPSDGSGE